MARTDALGLIIFLVGIGIIGFTLYLAYGMYVQFVTLGNTVSAPQINIANSSAASVQGIISSVVNGIISSMPLSRISYYALAILVLLLLANIGYKVSKLGLDFRRSGYKDQNAAPQGKNRA